MGKLDGKVALICYAGGGIGKATAELLKNEGAKLFVQDDAAEKLEGIPGEAIVADLRKKEDADKMIQTVLEKGGGKLDILVNNQDYVGAKKKITDLTMEDFVDVLDMNRFAGHISDHFHQLIDGHIFLTSDIDTVFQVGVHQQDNPIQ